MCAATMVSEAASQLRRRTAPASAGKTNSSQKGALNDRVPHTPVQAGPRYSAWVNAGITLALLIAALLVRVIFIHYPDEVVFDEVHFGKFASYYIKGEYFFDVHPPLAKLMIAAMAWLAGFDGKFEFDEIGDSYVEHNVPYRMIRLLLAIVGALQVPLVFQILRETGVSSLMSIVAALAILADNGHVLQSRLILLDAPLVLFMLCSLYCYIRFYAQRYSPFKAAWWTWLSLTGVSLACTISCKMVGVLTFATIGGAVILDLWNLLDIRRGLSMRVFVKHFCARAMCLIILPFLIYLGFFYIHFEILTQTGSGDTFMSNEFQQTLNGNEFLQSPVDLHAFDTITLRHRGTNAYLHSHADRYPLEYEDGRISSQGQQVTAYEHQDANNQWQILPLDPVDNEDGSFNETLRIIHHNQYIRLLHVNTSSYLRSHDVASPLMPTNMEFTTVPADTFDQADEETVADTVFRVSIDGIKNDDVIWRTRVDSVRLIHNSTGVAMWTHSDQRLPDWGFQQLEVNGNKHPKDRTTLWNAMDVYPDPASPLYESRSDISQEPLAPKKRSFWRKYTELQSTMLSHNNQLTDKHPYDSRPQSWPIMYDIVSYWTKETTREQVTFLGNVVSWWTSSLAVLAFVSIFVTDLLCRRRGLFYLSTPDRSRYLHTTGFFVYAWACHYLPFFLMHRQLFIHHYLPAHACSVLVLGGVLDFVTSRSIDLPLSPAGPALQPEQLRPTMRRRYTQLAQPVAFIVALSLVAMFHYLAPFTYGNVGLERAQVQARRMLSSWRLQFASDV